MELYEDQFDERHDSPGPAPNRTLVIASTPRCGSHMLGHLLHQTEVFGFPLEYLNRRNLGEWKTRLGCTTTPEVLSELMARRTSAERVFSLKLHYDHIFELGSPPSLQRFLPDPRVVLITRRDLVAQGVSHLRATQTGSWIAGQAPTDVAARYDFKTIDHLVRSAARDNASWAHFLSLSGLPWIHLAYEDIVADTSDALHRVADLMELSLDAHQIPATAPTKIQRSSTTSEWAERFRAESEGKALFPRDAELQRRLKRSLSRWIRKRRQSRSS